MVPHKPGTPQLMKQMNRAMVIDILTKIGPVSQTYICELTGLSRATVSTIVSELRKEELILEVDRLSSKSGRRRVLLELNAEAGYVIGIDLGGTKMAGAVTNLRGKVILRLKESTNAKAGPEAVFESLVQFIKRLITESKVEHRKVKGVGIGVPGIVVNKGTVQWAPALNWKDFPLANELKRYLDFPVYVENDVNLQALGEYWYGSGQGVDVLVCLAIGTGLGAGIIINGQLFTGTHQAAGEVCNMVANISQLGKNYPGFGFLESQASGNALATRFADICPSAPDNIDAEYVFERARNGDSQAVAVIDDFTRHLALAIVGIATVLDPGLIVLGGGVAQGADLFLSQLEAYASPVLQVMPRLVTTQLGAEAGVMGAVALTLHNTNEDPLRSITS
ncbi:MAG TPA: hypothetical protein DEB05_04170 [Firmicutes bacterium]|jgi:glucokinase|nr:hypothetical protein [Bacillota bacterium]HBT16136.1 hypothetical protein [Bacillota bacterium]